MSLLNPKSDILKKIIAKAVSKAIKSKTGAENSMRIFELNIADTEDGQIRIHLNGDIVVDGQDLLDMIQEM